MKALVVLFLFALPAMGQQQIQLVDTLHKGLEYRIEMGEPYMVWRNGSWDLGNHTADLYTDFIIPELLKDWDAYAKECYDDSTVVYHEEGGRRHSCLVYGCTKEWDIPPEKVFDYWTHHEPTFPGFIEYLRRRLTP